MTRCASTILDPPLADDAVEELDDQVALVAAQHVTALPADDDQLDLLALAQQLLDAAPRAAHDRAVEAAAQAAIGGGDDQQVHLVLAGAGQQRRRVGQARHAGGQVVQHRRSCAAANGRDASACSCARRSLEAATSFIALVILRVWRTELIRARMSLRLGIERRSYAKRSRNLSSVP